MKTLKKLISALFWFWLVSLAIGVSLLLFYFLFSFSGIGLLAELMIEMGVLYYPFAIYALYPAGIILIIFTVYKYFKVSKSKRLVLRRRLILYSILFLLNLPLAFLCFYIFFHFGGF